MSGGLRPLTTQNSQGQNYSQINDMMRQVNSEQQTKIFYGPNRIQALTTGKLKDLGYGVLLKDTTGDIRIAVYVDSNNEPVLKVSNVGFDATTAVDANLVFNSARNVFKVIKTDTFTSPALDAAGGANDTSTVVTDTGVASATPLAYVSYVVNDSGGYNQLPLISFNYGGSLQIYRSMAVELSGGNVHLRTFSQNYTGFPTSAVTIKYYLFAESVV